MEPHDLPGQFTHAVRLRSCCAPTLSHAVGAHRQDLADLSVPHALQEFLPCAAMPYHQTHAYLQALGVGLLREFQHPLRGGTVHGHRLLHEAMQALLDGVLKLHPAERRRRAEDHDVAGLHRVHRLFVGVEAQESAFLRNVHLRFELRLQFVDAGIELGRHHIGHGCQFHRSVGNGQRIDRRARSTPAAADERDVDRIVLRGEYVRQRNAGKRGYAGGSGGSGEELAPGSLGSLVFAHVGPSCWEKLISIDKAIAEGPR